MQQRDPHSIIARIKAKIYQREQTCDSQSELLDIDRIVKKLETNVNLRLKLNQVLFSINES